MADLQETINGSNHYAALVFPRLTRAIGGQPLFHEVILSMHTTNAAFERYYKMEADDFRDIYDDTCTKAPKSGKNIEFKQ